MAAPCGPPQPSAFLSASDAIVEMLPSRVTTPRRKREAIGRMIAPHEIILRRPAAPSAPDRLFREENGDSRSPALAALYIQPAAMQLGERANHRKPEPCALLSLAGFALFECA